MDMPVVSIPCFTMVVIEVLETCIIQALSQCSKDDQHLGNPPAHELFTDTVKTITMVTITMRNRLHVHVAVQSANGGRSNNRLHQSDCSGTAGSGSGRMDG